MTNTVSHAADECGNPEPPVDRRAADRPPPAADSGTQRMLRLQRELHGYGIERRNDSIRLWYWMLGAAGFLLLLLWWNR